jgi:hypothetical protein
LLQELDFLQEGRRFEPTAVRESYVLKGFLRSSLLVHCRMAS